ncbi:MAG: hypothetical protein VYC34_02780, partial [Planctomycetota bacterium]|nr:hypothetical protein [Planctomycetota bacterium]
SQRWVMLRGRRVEPSEIGWLMGPFGMVGEVADDHVARLARDEGLEVERRTSGAGLIESVERFGLDEAARARLRPEIAAFYERTADHDLEVWSEWGAAFRPGAAIIRALYSRRLQQLDLPQRPLDTSRGVSSEIITFRERGGGAARYTVWHRILKSTGQVIYSGFYDTCRLPDGRTCVKVAFPLPNGNATVVMDVVVDEAGNLELISEGERFGDAGFYFLLRDRKGRH